MAPTPAWRDRESTPIQDSLAADRWVRVVILAAGYTLTGIVGLSLAVPPGYATAVWPPSGIALAAVLLWGPRVWPGIAAGSLLVNLAVGMTTADLSFGVLSVTVAAGIAVRRPRQLSALLLWASPAAALVLLYQWIYFGAPWRHGFSASLGRFDETWGLGHAGLLVSPAKGLLVFTPVALVAVLGMVRSFRRGERWLVATLATAVVGHWLLMGRWSEWHGGESWGPRMMTDVLPLLFLFLPEGLDVLPSVGAGLAALSVAVQALGAFAYDYRWERLYQRRSAELRV